MLKSLHTAGREESMRALYRAYGPELYGFALSALGDRGHAEELVQEVFTRVWRKAASYDASRASFRTWLYGIARNAIIDQRRRAAVRPALGAQAVDADEERTTDSSLEHALLRWQVSAALDRLTPEHRQVIRLAHYQGLTLREIAERTGAAARHGQEPHLIRAARAPARARGDGGGAAMSTPPGACADCRDLVGGYVLAALDRDEMATVRRHLDACPPCAAEHLRLIAIPALLDLAREPCAGAAERPSDRLEETVLDRFAREHRTSRRSGGRARRGVDARARGKAALARLRRPLPVATAAALAAAAVTVAIGLSGGGSPGGGSLGEVYQARLSGSSAAPSARAFARLETVSSGTRVDLRVSGLRGAPDDEFELWCVRDGGSRVSAGTFRVDGGGRAQVKLTTAAVAGEYHRLSVERTAAAGARPSVSVMAGAIRFGSS